MQTFENSPASGGLRPRTPDEAGQYPEPRPEIYSASPSATHCGQITISTSETCVAYWANHDVHYREAQFHQYVLLISHLKINLIFLSQQLDTIVYLFLSEKYY